MKNNDLDIVWEEVESQQNSRERFLQRMVCVNLLYRAYAGASGIPPKRFLSLEIPKEDVVQFDTFTAPQGFTLSIDEPGVKHEGFVACVLQAANSEQNDVFTIVAKDILINLTQQNESEKYVETLKKRIEKWRDFFKNSNRKRLSERMVIGLFGELFFIQEAIEEGVEFISDMWNGPIKSAQDFQGENIAIEVKTSLTNELEYVHISSEIQLDEGDCSTLFLVLYRIERGNGSGVTLPELIEKVSGMLNEQQRTRFTAKLTCLGYLKEDAPFYSKSYLVKECRSYRVGNGFPRILRSDLPQGIADVSYSLGVHACEEYVVEFDELPHVLKEQENGED